MHVFEKVDSKLVSVGSSNIYVHQNRNTEIRQNVDEEMSSNMKRINKELESHSQQLEKISNDVKELHKVNGSNLLFIVPILHI